MNPQQQSFWQEILADFGQKPKSIHECYLSDTFGLLKENNQNNLKYHARRLLDQIRYRWQLFTQKLKNELISN